MGDREPRVEPCSFSRRLIRLRNMPGQPSGEDWLLNHEQAQKLRAGLERVLADTPTICPECGGEVKLAFCTVCHPPPATGAEFLEAARAAGLTLRPEQLDVVLARLGADPRAEMLPGEAEALAEVAVWAGGDATTLEPTGERDTKPDNGPTLSGRMICDACGYTYTYAASDSPRCVSCDKPQLRPVEAAETLRISTAADNDEPGTLSRDDLVAMAAETAGYSEVRVGGATFWRLLGMAMRTAEAEVDRDRLRKALEMALRVLPYIPEAHGLLATLRDIASGELERIAGRLAAEGAEIPAGLDVAQLARAEEREACARVAEEHNPGADGAGDILGGVAGVEGEEKDRG